MELDDFKTTWGKDVKSNMTRALLLQKVSRIEKSGRKIRKAVVVEAAIIGVLYLLFIGAIIFFNEQIQSFIYKLIIILSIGFSPIAYRLYQSQRWVNAIDYSADIRSNLVAFLTYYRTTLRWYWWSSVIISALLFVMLFTDEDFLNIPMAWQIGTCAYIVLVLLLTRPYLRNFYGKHVKEFEAFLES
jgi:hypothetical protein